VHWNYLLLRNNIAFSLYVSHPIVSGWVHKFGIDGRSGEMDEEFGFFRVSLMTTLFR
jgi:hypothetical protein